MKEVSTRTFPCFCFLDFFALITGTDSGPADASKLNGIGAILEEAKLLAEGSNSSDECLFEVVVWEREEVDL